MALTKTIVGLSTATLMAVLMTGTANAHDGSNVATGHADGILKDRWGNCIVSKSGNELCNKVEPPKQVCRDVKTCRTVPTNITINKRLAGDTTFNFDKSSLTAAGSAELTTMVSSLNGVNVSGVTVVGHTDAVGSNAYNQALSERRSNTVAAFLASNGVAAGKISAIGKGESDAKFPSSASNAERMSDRRVDITVNGVTTGKGGGKQVCSVKRVCTTAPAAKK